MGWPQRTWIRPDRKLGATVLGPIYLMSQILGPFPDLDSQVRDGSGSDPDPDPDSWDHAS